MDNLDQREPFEELEEAVGVAEADEAAVVESAAEEPLEAVEAEADAEVEADAEAEVFDEAELVADAEQQTAIEPADELAIIPADEPGAIEPADKPTEIVAAEEPGELAPIDDDDELEDEFPYRKRTDARCTFLLGLWSIILCFTILGSPFAVILSIAGKRLKKYSEEDYSLTRNGRVGSKLCNIGIVLGAIIFVVAVAGCALIWFKLRF